MADAPTPVEAPKTDSLTDKVKAYQALTDPQKRADYYKANPELKAVYSAVNHS